MECMQYGVRLYFVLELGGSRDIILQKETNIRWVLW